MELCRRYLNLDGSCGCLKCCGIANNNCIAGKLVTLPCNPPQPQTATEEGYYVPGWWGNRNHVYAKNWDFPPPPMKVTVIELPKAA